MTDVRHAFSEATAGFVDAVLSVPDDAWVAPGLGVWNVRQLVGHTSRALVTVEQYLDTMPAEVTIHSPFDYYTLGLQVATTTLHDDVAERGRQAGAALGDDPVPAIRELCQRVLDRVAANPTTQCAPRGSAGCSSSTTCPRGSSSSQSTRSISPTRSIARPRCGRTRSR